jgi:Tfp pilus assembly protein PilF/TolB-like protein
LQPIAIIVSILKRPIYFFALLRLPAFLLFVSLVVAAQVPTPSAHTVLVLPFENASNAPGLQWISEAFPEVIGQRLSFPSLYVISRDDRNYAFDRLSIPTNVHPSRATMYRIAEQMDADYVVMGEYTFDGQSFRASAQVLDMKNLKLSKDQLASGPLVSLMDIEREIAWQVLHIIQPQVRVSRQEFLRETAPIRLDAFENYIRGVLATTRPEKTKYLKEAIRLNPQYAAAMLQLARAYFTGRDYEQAAAWFAKVPPTDPAAGEASFMLGLSNYYSGQFEKAEQAFRATEARLPLTEVYNNLGVVSSRRGKRVKAVEYFQKAVQADPTDPDYRFNLAVALYRNGEMASASRQLREVTSRRPNDTEARALMDVIGSSLNRAADGSQPAPRVPLERVKRNYDENSYRQLALEITNAMEQSLAKADPRTHASFHVDRGRDLLHQGFTAEAEKEFREAIMRDPTSAAAHAGLAQASESLNDTAAARNEAATSLRLQPNIDAYLVIARLEMNDNKLDAATEAVERALALEPANSNAVAVKRAIEAKRSGQSQSVPQL